MATPYGHALMGLSLLNLCFPRPTALSNQSGLIMGGTLLVALFPDLDFLPGLLIGQPSHFHQGPFHSLGLAVGLALAVGLILILIKRSSSIIPVAGFVFILILSHLVMDYLSEDNRPPIGFPFFWPFSDQRVNSAVSIFPHAIRDITRPEFWRQNSLVFMVESLLLWPIYLATRLRLERVKINCRQGEVDRGTFGSYIKK